MSNRWSLTLALIFTFIFTAVAAAQEPPTCKGINVVDELKTKNPALHKEIITKGAKYKNGNALLWRVEKENVEDSYLYGTVHITDPRIHKLSAQTKAAFKGARVLILEAVNLNETTMGKAMMKVMPQTVFNPLKGKGLSDYLSADELALTLKISKSLGMPADMVKMVKPWLIAIAMALPPCEVNRAKAGLISLDARLEADAKKMGKPAIGLETAESQLSAMAAIPVDAQAAWLKSSLEQYDRTEDFLEPMVELYLSRNLGQMFPLSIKISKDPENAKIAMDTFQKSLIVKRNIGMATGAKPEIDKGNAFIGVGALHLGGEQGLVDLLRKEGYTVTAIE